VRAAIFVKKVAGNYLNYEKSISEVKILASRRIILNILGLRGL
jgi:hypothetical protein